MAASKTVHVRINRLAEDSPRKAEGLLDYASTESTYDNVDL